MLYEYEYHNPFGLCIAPYVLFTNNDLPSKDPEGKGNIPTSLPRRHSFVGKPPTGIENADKTNDNGINLARFSNQLAEVTTNTDQRPNLVRGKMANHPTLLRPTGSNDLSTDKASESFTAKDDSFKKRNREVYGTGSLCSPDPTRGEIQSTSLTRISLNNLLRG